MMRAHSAPWGGKRCVRDGASQIVIGITVSAGKIRTGEAKDGLNLNSGLALREQVSGDPKIHDAPIRLRKAFLNMPSLHTAPVDRDRLRGAGWARVCGGPGDWQRRVRRLYRLPDGLQQRRAARRQTRTGVDKSHPRGVAVGRASCRLLIGESREPSQVTPVGAGPIATIEVCQMPAGRGRQGRFQRRGTEANPSLQMAGAGLYHQTGVMPVGTHEVHGRGIGTIQIDQDIACVLVSGVGVNVHITPLAVASAQKADGSGTRQLGCCPKPFSRERATCLLVNQTDQVQFVGHRREMSADGLPGQKESTVVHDSNCAIEATRRTMNPQRTANSVLTVCLTSGGRRNSLCSGFSIRGSLGLVSNPATKANRSLGEACPTECHECVTRTTVVRRARVRPVCRHSPAQLQKGGLGAAHIGGQRAVCSLCLVAAALVRPDEESRNTTIPGYFLPLRTAAQDTHSGVHRGRGHRRIRESSADDRRRRDSTHPKPCWRRVCTWCLIHSCAADRRSAWNTGHSRMWKAGSWR